MAKKTRFLLISILLLIFCTVFSLTTFNPITNYFQIQQTKAILENVKSYDNKSLKIQKVRNLYFEKGLNFDQRQNDFIEKMGFTVTINSNNEYLGIISSGFDNTIVYNYSQDCWSSQHVKIVGLATCRYKNW